MPFISLAYIENVILFTKIPFKWVGVGSVVGQRRRRWASIEPALAAHHVFVGQHCYQHPPHIYFLYPEWLVSHFGLVVLLCMSLKSINHNYIVCLYTLNWYNSLWRQQISKASAKNQKYMILANVVFLGRIEQLYDKAPLDKTAHRIMLKYFIFWARVNNLLVHLRFISIFGESQPSNCTCLTSNLFILT